MDSSQIPINHDKNIAKDYREKGEKYLYGIEVTPDYQTAYSYFKKAADLNDDAAMEWLEQYHSLGMGSYNVNPKEAYRWRKKRKDCILEKANLGDLDAKYSLAKLYLHGDPRINFPKDEGMAEKLLMELAESEFPDAYNKLGKFYVTHHDKKKTLYCYLKYAEYDPVDAYRQIASDFGLVFKDKQISSTYTEKYLKIVKTLAQREIPYYMHMLGYEYMFGRRVHKDFNKALYWHRKAIEGENVPERKGLYCMGVAHMYIDSCSFSVTKSKAENILYWLKAAYKYNPRLAGLLLEDLYWDGKILEYDIGKYVNVDQALGFELLNRRSHEGSQISRIRLAKSFFYGKGEVEKDLFKAKMWFEKALAVYEAAGVFSEERQEVQYYLEQIRGYREIDFNFFTGCNNWNEIQIRYRHLMKTYHPDTGTGNEEVSKLINLQYDNLNRKYNGNKKDS